MAAPNTLGALLYANDATTPVREADWVDLVRSIAAGDQTALRVLYERSHRLVFTLAVRICASRESAEEVTLDVFHDVWRRSSQYDPANGTVVGWIMNQARSRAIDRVRFEQRKKRVNPDGGDTSDETPPPGAASLLDGERQRSSLRGALAALTADERRAIETAFFGELTYAETAVELAEPLGTVKTRVRSALAKLRRVLDENGGPR